MPKNPVRPTEDIQRRFAAGESLMTAQTVTDYGVSTALLHATMRSLRKQGWVFDVISTGGSTAPKIYRQTSPKPVKDEAAWGPAKGVTKLAGRGPAKKVRSDKGQTHRRPAKQTGIVAAMNGQPAAVARIPTNGNALHHPVPQLGDKVEVYLLMLGEDGRVNVGLRDGSSAWLVGVDGFVARER